ncbi:MAG: hypothetical protein L0Z70_00220 [Chloroflexi bacterium]|nr:hypothetical protein [Chloroflexota bacterium]
MAARWVRFFLTVLVGAAGGLFYGWVVNPVNYVDTTPDSLRVDYQADYVLMTAEAYGLENDPALAARRLALLGEEPPLEIVRQALIFAEGNGYIDPDLATMRRLYQDMQTFSPALQGGAP